MILRHQETASRRDATMKTNKQNTPYYTYFPKLQLFAKRNSVAHRHFTLFCLIKRVGKEEGNDGGRALSEPVRMHVCTQRQIAVVHGVVEPFDTCF